MRLLFIKTGHIGDALIMTPAIVATKRQNPGAEIWVIVRKGSEQILHGCPEIDRVLTTSAPEKSHRKLSDLIDNLRLIHMLRERRFDVIVELGESSRGRWLALFSGGKRRATDGSARQLSCWWRLWFIELRMPVLERKLCHRVIKDMRVTALALNTMVGDPPGLRFATERVQSWPSVPSGKYVVLHPGTRWARKRWPVENWGKVGRHLTSAGFQVVVSAGPDENDVAEARLLCTLIGPHAVSTAGQTNWPQLAGILHQSEFFAGVDTAAMHLAAACGKPVVAVFGPSKVPYWYPWKVPHRIVRPPDAYDPWLPDNVLKPHTDPNTQEVKVADVIAACDSIIVENQLMGTSG